MYTLVRCTYKIPLLWCYANQTKPTPAIWSENKTQQLKGCTRQSTPRILNRHKLKLVVGQLRWFEISRSLCLYLREDGLEWARQDFPNTLLTWCDKLICVNRTKTVGESVKSGNELGCVFLWGDRILVVQFRHDPFCQEIVQLCAAISSSTYPKTWYVCHLSVFLTGGWNLLRNRITRCLRTTGLVLSKS